MCQKPVKLRTIILRNSLFLVLTATSFGLIASAPQIDYSFIEATLVPISNMEEVVQQVREANGKPLTAEQIDEIDLSWRQEIGLNPLMQQLMNNPCGKLLKSIADESHLLREIFVMDKRGANVCMSHKTSDYWQGDEDKFTESFKQGEGGRHISKIEFDESTQAFLVQVSLPIMDQGQAIGAITFGLDVEEIN